MEPDVPFLIRMSGIVIDLNELRIFADVVDAGGFSAAKRKTGIPTSTLSRRVANLETTLGVQLLYRNSGKFGVTEFGRLLHEHCRAMTNVAQTGIEQLQTLIGKPGGTLRISCPIQLSSLFVGRLAVEFAAIHPAVRIAFEAATRPINPIIETYDVAIQVSFNELPNSEAIARRLGGTGVTLLAAPGLLENKSEITHPDQLNSFDCIGFGNVDHEFAWAFTGPDKNVVEHRFRARFTTDSINVALDAACEGLGIACLPTHMCEGALKAGRLLPVLENWKLPSVSFHALYPPRRSVGSAALQFVDFLKERFEGELKTTTEAAANAHAQSHAYAYGAAAAS
jgi:DNA-binding transcriptional LysR family regulator